MVAYKLLDADNRKSMARSVEMTFLTKACVREKKTVLMTQQVFYRYCFLFSHQYISYTYNSNCAFPDWRAASNDFIVSRTLLETFSVIHIYVRNRMKRKNVLDSKIVIPAINVNHNFLIT